MPSRIALPALLTLLDEGAQLVEVLPHEEYSEEHLPRAINIPLKDLKRRDDRHARSDQTSCGLLL